MKTISMLLVACCFASFAWGRRSFFVKTDRTDRHRGGLGPVGTLFCVLDLTLLALQQSFSGGAVVVGVVFVLVSLGVFWWSVVSYEGRRPHIAHTPRADFILNLRGPYYFVRHPFYVSYMLLWFGAAFLLSDTLLWLVAAMAAIVMSALYHRTAVREEAEILGSIAGKDYALYMQVTGRFFPRVLQILKNRKT